MNEQDIIQAGLLVWAVIATVAAQHFYSKYFKSRSMGTALLMDKRFYEHVREEFKERTGFRDNE